MRFSLASAAVAAAFITATPSAAYTLTGVVQPGGTGFSRDLKFYRDGPLAIDVSFTSNTGFYVSSSSALQYSNFFFYDFYDPQTGEKQGGSDNSGDFAVWEYFGLDDTGPGAPNSYAFQLSYPDARIRRDYEIKAPGDRFPSEIGYTQTLLNLNGEVFGNGDPVTYRISVTGSAVVPEPVAWAMLIVGFGLTGTTARLRRRAISS